MRIAIVSTPFVSVPPPGYGGTELVVHALVRALERAGHDVAVFATGDSQVPGLRARFAAPVWPPDPYIELLHSQFAAREIAGGGFDVVHAHLPSLLAFAAELPAPMVYTLHHAQLPSMERFYAAVPPVRRVAISRRQAELADPPAHHVVHHGLDGDLYPVAGPGGGGGVFLGRLSRCKAPDLAVAAARLAGLPLLVAGEVHAGDDGPDWEEELRAALRQPHVRWIGGADLAAKRRAFARARAVMVPLRWEEPFGLVMLEAMLAGCPVIAWPLGAAPELVEDGVDGFLVESVREAALALRRAQVLDRRTIQARARERFSADRMARGYLAVYREAVADHLRHAGPAEAGEGDGWTTLAR